MFNEDTMRKILVIKKDYALDYTSQAVKLMVQMAYQDKYPLYKEKLLSVKKPVEEKIKERMEVKEEKEKAIVQYAKDKLIETATAPYPNGLEGTIYGTEGKEMVDYWVYFERGRDKCTLPLVEIAGDLIEAQYSPSYDEVKRLQSINKTDYKI